MLDAFQHVQILLARIGVKRGHDAAAPQVFDADDNWTNPKLAAFPLALGQTFDTADDEIGAEAPPVEAGCLEHSVGRNQQREDIETVRPVAAHQAGVWSGGGFNVARNFFGEERAPIHQRLAVRIECNSFGLVRAVRIFPFARRTCTMRSPSIPCSVRRASSKGSPAIDFTG
jgi:hypothetical protein